jgi:peptide chain release factor 1
MDDQVREKLAEVEKVFEDTLVQLTDNQILSNQDRYREVTQRHAELKPIVEAYRRYLEAETEKSEATELLAGEEDADMVAYLSDLAEDLTTELEELETGLRLMLVPKDPDDDKDVIVEIRSAAGGDEAALWAGDLLRMYERFVERMGWKFETISVSISDGGGIKEGTFSIKGLGAYSRFKFEAGPHRVQRVPNTESQGRIHTSMATVAVLPEVEAVEVDVHENDLEIDTFRATGPGGQSVNTTDSAVRITHKPTGIVVTCQDEKSQLQNKVKAMRVLRARLYQAQMAEQLGERASARKSQIGTGDRSEKIRTYNFKENRVTDHRIGLTLHSLGDILDGDLDRFHEALMTHEAAERLAEVE